MFECEGNEDSSTNLKMNQGEDFGAKAFKRALNNVRGKMKNNFLNNYPHCILPGCNLNREPDIENWDAQSVLDLFAEFPYSCEFPKPLLPPARLPECVLRGEDPSLQLLTTKFLIKDEIDRITEYRGKYKKDSTKCNKKEVKWNETDKNTVYTVLPRYVALLAEIFDSDPDPQFEGEYNWYYTGGTLDSFSLRDKNVLLFPYAGELVAAPIVAKSNSIWKPCLKKAAKCVLDETLYEVKHNVTNNICRVLGRFKNHCILYSLSGFDDKLELIEIHKQTSQRLYTAADFDPSDSNKYCVANTDRLVEIWDINRRNCLSGAEVLKTKVMTDNWSSVKFHKSDPNVIEFVDRCCLHQMDTRVSLERPALTICPKADLETCDSLSLNFSSLRGDFYQYLGTYHNLLMCDCRFEKKCVMQKWTHQFKSAPLLASIRERNEQEVIVLSSQLSGENSIILNNRINEDKLHSHSLPYTPPSILETLRTSQKRGKCLDPFMRTRLELSNVGSTQISDADGHLYFVCQNSIGDVFYQCITHEDLIDEYSSVNCGSLSAMDAWERAIPKQSKTVKPLVVSEKANMLHVYNALKNSNLRLESNDEVKNNYIVPKWDQSMEKLSSYMDLLAPELLSIWDVSDDTIPVPITAAPHQKVLSWLEKSNASVNAPTQSQEDQYTPISINSQELISVSQDPELVIIQDNESVQELYAPVIKTKTSNRKVLKKKFVSGF